ncbi:hypothetical protein [Kitasatospora sp. NPDC058218]|uniref:hypothetical protein n=1 Tax=Kitasatospora sp. NPDC058218 TaxID=3346385 RepID=UPI0036D9CF3D
MNDIPQIPERSHGRVADLIAEAARRRDAEQARRARYAAAREWGLQARIRAKLARLAAPSDDHPDDEDDGPDAA